MWLLSMNQRRCGSALPYFLLCFLEHPGIAQPQQAQQGWRLGPVPSAHPRRRQLKGGQPWVMGVPQKGGFEEECEAWPPRGRCWRGGKGKEKVLGGGGKRAGKGAGGGKQAGKGAELRLLGLSRGSCCCPIPVPLPTQPTVEVQPSCLAPLVLPVLLTIVLTFPNLRSSTAKGKVGRAESSMRAEHPQRTAGTKPERRASALGREEKGEHLLCLKWKAK